MPMAYTITSDLRTALLVVAIRRCRKVSRESPIIMSGSCPGGAMSLVRYDGMTAGVSTLASFPSVISKSTLRWYRPSSKVGTMGRYGIQQRIATTRAERIELA